MRFNEISSLVTKYTLLLSSSVMISIVKCTFYELNTTYGCPFTFDIGNYGIKYLKPSVCKKLLPDKETISETPEEGPSPFTLKLYYTDLVDTFRLHVTSENKTPMLEVWVTTSRVTTHGKLEQPVGAFLPEFNYELYCCDNTKLKTVARYSSGADSRIDNMLFLSANFKWAPLKFIGRFVFIANILISDTNWYGGITSSIYMMPPFIPDVLRNDSLELSSYVHFWSQEILPDDE